MAPGKANQPPATDGSGTPMAPDRPGASIAGFVSRLTQQTGDLHVGRYAPDSLPGSDPALGLAILTCMDARVDLASRLGISPGDAHILRNAGGRVTPDVIRSLLLSVRLMNVREVGILHHTSCALEGMDNDLLARRIGIRSMDFLPFASLQDSVRADVIRVVSEGILPAGSIVWGAVYDLATGQIQVTHGPMTVTPQYRRLARRPRLGLRPSRGPHEDLASGNDRERVSVAGRAGLEGWCAGPGLPG
jgi:carbonic anhydrase